MFYERSYLIDITDMAWEKRIWKAYICIMDHFNVHLCRLLQSKWWQPFSDPFAFENCFEI